jgi:hypothetical protein
MVKKKQKSVEFFFMMVVRKGETERVKKRSKGKKEVGKKGKNEKKERERTPPSLLLDGRRNGFS